MCKKQTIKEIKNFKFIIFEVSIEIPNILESGSDTDYCEEFKDYKYAIEAYKKHKCNKFSCILYWEEVGDERPRFTTLYKNKFKDNYNENCFYTSGMYSYYCYNAITNKLYLIKEENIS